MPRISHGTAFRKARVTTCFCAIRVHAEVIEQLHVAVEQQVFALLSCNLRSDVCIVAFQRLRDNISQSTERTGRSCEKLSSQ